MMITFTGGCLDLFWKVNEQRRKEEKKERGNVFKNLKRKKQKEGRGERRKEREKVLKHYFLLNNIEMEHIFWFLI